MLPHRLFLAATALLLTSGCGYIHFGRIPEERRGGEALHNAFTDVVTRQKILMQELEIARKERDTLRDALERGAGPAATTDLARQLEKTAQELADLRVAHRTLQNERAGAAAPAPNTNALALQDENRRLQEELDRARRQNADLAEKLTASVAAAEQAHATLSQLNTDLLAERQARERAEQASVALRAQLQAVMARAGRIDEVAAPSPTPATAPSAAAAPTLGGSFSSLRAGPSEAVPMVELRTSAARARVSSPPSPSPATTAATAEPAPRAAEPRTYVVLAGDTLEKIAVKVYGSADAWGRIYDANAPALGQGGLKAGMQLTIPENE